MGDGGISSCFMFFWSMIVEVTVFALDKCLVVQTSENFHWRWGNYKRKTFAKIVIAEKNATAECKNANRNAPVLFRRNVEKMFAKADWCSRCPKQIETNFLA